MCGKTDLRKGIDTLAVLLQTEFNQDPFDGGYYFFCGNRKDRFKILHWDGEGFRLEYKRFENGKLQWPSAETPYLQPVSNSEINRLLKGYSLQPSIKKSSKKILF